MISGWTEFLRGTGIPYAALFKLPRNRILRVITAERAINKDDLTNKGYNIPVLYFIREFILGKNAAMFSLGQLDERLFIGVIDRGFLSKTAKFPMTTSKPLVSVDLGSKIDFGID